jgi:hypothetical protein
MPTLDKAPPSPSRSADRCARSGSQSHCPTPPTHEIICPHCGKAFKIDEAGYADILKQVRDHDFDQQLHERLELAEQDKQKAVELATIKITSKLEMTSVEKDAEIKALKAKLDAGAVAQKLAVKEAQSALEKERDTLANDLKQATRDQKTAAELADAKLANELLKAATTKDTEVQSLKSGLERAQLEKELAEKSLKDKYETQIKDRENEIERLREMKARLSTKMVGETLEQHCETEFNRIRATAFPRCADWQQGRLCLSRICRRWHRSSLCHVRDEERER